MTDDFFNCAFHEIRRGLAMLVVPANLDRTPETLTQAVARRVKTRLKELETILRRLIMLIALGLTLAPVKPRTRPPAETAEDPVFTKSQPLYSCALSGQVRVFSLEGTEFPEAAGHATGPVPAAPLLRRIAGLARILRAPDRYAVRLARTLERLRRAGATRPLCLSMPTHRLHPELGLLAAGLPYQLADAWDRWTGSG